MGWTEKTKRALFIGLLVLIPTQLGRHFWPEWTYVNGVRIDYFSPTLYITDILIILLLVWEIFNFQFSIFSKFLKPKLLIFTSLLIIFVFFNIKESLSPAVSAYKWLKIGEIGAVVWLVKKNKPDWRFLAIPLAYEGILAGWQMALQRSVGGIWWWLGERTFTSESAGIANTFFQGQLLLRSYGTFSHPNILGGFATVVLIILGAVYLREKRGKRWLAAAMGLGIVALGMSLSRSALVIGGLGLSASLKGFRKVTLILMLVAAGWVFLSRGTSWGEESFQVREEIGQAAWERFRHSPLLGTGLGTMPLDRIEVKNFALRYQPVHNIYFLAGAETGVLGLAGLVGVLVLTTKRLVKKRDIGRLGAVLVVAVLGLSDHYFLTSQQGNLVVGLVLGWAWA